tara:strand:+ start:446 stop:790 length:345 start_codon:yes stop_codon:yes gene_type:complete
MFLGFFVNGVSKKNGECHFEINGVDFVLIFIGKVLKYLGFLSFLQGDLEESAIVSIFPKLFFFFFGGTEEIQLVGEKYKTLEKVSIFSTSTPIDTFLKDHPVKPGCHFLYILDF